MASPRKHSQKQDRRAAIVFCTVVAVLLLALVLLLGWLFFLRPAGEDAQTAPSPSPTVAAAVRAVDTPVPEPTATPFSPRTVTIRAVGDVMMHEAQLDAAARPGEGYDFSPQYADIAPSLMAADYTIANLETTVGLYSDQPYSGFPMFNAPPELLTALRRGGRGLRHHGQQPHPRPLLRWHAPHHGQRRGRGPCLRRRQPLQRRATGAEHRRGGRRQTGHALLHGLHQRSGKAQRPAGPRVRRQLHRGRGLCRRGTEAARSRRGRRHRLHALGPRVPPRGQRRTARRHRPPARRRRGRHPRQPPARGAARGHARGERWRTARSTRRSSPTASATSTAP